MDTEQPHIKVKDRFTDEPDQFFMISKHVDEEKTTWNWLKRRAQLFNHGNRTALSFDDELVLMDSNGVCRRARVLVCKCEKQQFWSIAARFGDSKENKKLRAKITGIKFRELPTVLKDEGPLSILDIVSALSSCFNGTEIKAKGLIVIAGSTSAGKTKIAEGLVLSSLDGFKLYSAEHEKPKPGEAHQCNTQEAADSGMSEPAESLHVLTVEAPITSSMFTDVPQQTDEVPSDSNTDASDTALDKPVYSRMVHNGKEAKLTNITVTRRCLSANGSERDAYSLNDILVIDARRQKPHVVYIDEVREDGDWKHIVDFALTKHLVITTTHASTLPETISRIMRACGCANASDRARVGRALLAVIHLGSFKWDQKGKDGRERNAIIPSVWLRSKSSIKGLAWPGESSIVPEKHKTENNSTATASTLANSAIALGRTHFVESWFDNLTKGNPDADAIKRYEDLRKKAIQSDLQEY